MTYDHSRKAGNLGDVWKHNVLVALVDAMPGNLESFRYVECHAGAPIHNLTDGGEWVRGVKVVKQALRDSCYMTMANEWLDRGQYPASWMFVADRLARRFAHVEMTLFDDADYVAAQYPPPAAGIPTNVRLAFRQADGYAAAAKLDRADLVFLDPPYHPNAVKDWERLGRTCRALASQRVAFAAWYPFFWPTRPQKLVDFTECEAWEVAWAPCGSRQSQNLKGCGMLVSHELAVHLRRIEEDIRAVAACMNSDMSTRRPAAT